MREDGKMDYIELPARDIEAAKRFYSQAFGWAFQDYGPRYAAFEEGLDGGLNGDAGDATKAPLPIVYANDLEEAERKVREAGGEVVRPIFSFPGGRRFHFRDPSGNELAVWSAGQ